MATPELPNTPSPNTPSPNAPLPNAPVGGEGAEPAAGPGTAAPPAAPVADDSDWFKDFERVEKVFYILSGAMVVSALVAYLGLRLENDPIFIASVIVLSGTLVGMGGLIMPLGWAFLKGFRHWRRRRATESGREKQER